MIRSGKSVRQVGLGLGRLASNAEPESTACSVGEQDVSTMTVAANAILTRFGLANRRR